MSTQRLGASGSADGSRQWLRIPETVREWLVVTVDRLWRRLDGIT